MAELNQLVGDLRLGSVVINVLEMNRAVCFWTAALGYVRRDQEWDPEFTVLVDPDRRRPSVSLQLTSSPPHEPTRIHLDLYTSEQARHVDRLVELGAMRAEE